uniref:Uncharacterized protein n=1 Tax=Glossina austeni TaxID=7395 RepID=A0A1A9V6F1_GLOAU
MSYIIHSYIAMSSVQMCTHITDCKYTNNTALILRTFVNLGLRKRVSNGHVRCLHVMSFIHGFERVSFDYSLYVRRFRSENSQRPPFDLSRIVPLGNQTKSSYDLEVRSQLSSSFR